MTLKSCSNDVGIAFGSWFSKRDTHISERVSIGAHCLIGSCSIGQDTLIGSNVDILSGRHQHGVDIQAGERNRQESTFQQLLIGSNVWIGNRTVIMADIGDNSIIGAGSVVVHAVSSNSLAVGNPARSKRTLTADAQSAPTIDSTPAITAI
ncbi:DapH/DapD/GlmU-related protein [Aeoliella mucimassa]